MSINVHPDPLPEERRNDPRRRAEMSILDQLARSCLDGAAYYEWKADGNSQEVDFVVWVEQVGRYAIQVKGGQYALRHHDWHLVLSDGRMEKRPSPMVEAWDGAISFHDVVEDVLDLYAFIIPVLVFPDMDYDPYMAALASKKGVQLIWRGQDLSARLEEIAATEVVRRPPARHHVENELHAIMYREPLRPAAPARRGGPARAAAAVPGQVEVGANLVINNYGPLILLAATPENLAGVMASISSAAARTDANPEPAATDTQLQAFSPPSQGTDDASPMPW